jgi:hypothetical protein
MTTTALDALLLRLRSSFGASVSIHVLEHQTDRLTIQIGENADSLVGIEIRDEQRPAFRVSYPQLTIKRNGERRVSSTISDGILADGVLWVVGELARHGVVKPEFSD